jgi:hypothetical protein
VINAYQYIITVGKPEWKTPLGRPRYRWVDNNKMHLHGVVDMSVPYSCGNMYNTRVRRAV